MATSVHFSVTPDEQLSEAARLLRELASSATTDNAMKHCGDAGLALRELYRRNNLPLRWALAASKVLTQDFPSMMMGVRVWTSLWTNCYGRTEDQVDTKTPRAVAADLNFIADECGKFAAELAEKGK